ncbi:hypothetical protein [Cellulomonas sp. ICMP 17802]|uniref:hypothetical protein n=1 Tax=Cellulomonas sp. ICMP 17802 TaxID=3239199 RepID=UPI00351B880E
MFRRRTGWDLADATERHAAAPDRFRVPGDEVLAALRVGDRVKVIVVPRQGLEERVWLTVVRVGELELEGRLESEPVEVRGLHAGDPVVLERRHVVTVTRPLG